MSATFTGGKLDIRLKKKCLTCSALTLIARPNLLDGNRFFVGGKLFCEHEEVCKHIDDDEPSVSDIVGMFGAGFEEE